MALYRMWCMHKLLQAAQASVHGNNRYWPIIGSLRHQIAIYFYNEAKIIVR